MICKNCNYILTGKENFCPNCGTVPEAAASPFPKIREAPSQSEENIFPETNPSRSLNELIFSEKIITSEPATPELKVYSSDADEEKEEASSEKNYRSENKKSAAGKIFILLFICCSLAVTAFGLADYFGITPKIKNYVSTFSPGEPTTVPPSTTDVFSHESTVILPDSECVKETAYVFSGEGLTLRKGPSNSYAPLYNLTDLTMVQIFGSSLANPEWVYVYCPEKDSYGWLNGSYLCSDVIGESELYSEYESVEDIPTNYYY